MMENSVIEHKSLQTLKSKVLLGGDKVRFLSILYAKQGIFNVHIHTYNVVSVGPYIDLIDLTHQAYC